MVRLKTRAYDSDVQAFFNRFSDSPDVKYWENRNFKNYRYNWLFQGMDSFGKQRSFWCGFSHNSETVGSKHSLIVEYNPNKCDDMDSLYNILRAFYSVDYEVGIMSVDFACDMPINILNLSYGLNFKGGVARKIFDYGGDNKTYYLKEGDGRIKIYNKSRELGLSDMDLTRFEISLDVNCNLFFTEGFKFPADKLISLYSFENYQFSLDVNGTDRAILYSIMNGFPINDLPRTKRQKIEKILSESVRITLDSNMFEKAFILYFKQLKDTISSLKNQMK